MGKSLHSMSGGWHMRASLATTLLVKADILLLDEPTNFLDMTGIIWLQRHLLSLTNPPTMITVSHDRAFITDLCTDLLILKDQKLTTFTGTIPAYESSQSEHTLSLSRTLAAQQRQRRHVEKTIRQNTRSGRENNDGNKLGQAKSRQKKLDDRWGLQVNARGGRFKLNRDLGGGFISRRGRRLTFRSGRGLLLSGFRRRGELRFPGSLVSLEGVSFAYASSCPPDDSRHQPHHQHGRSNRHPRPKRHRKIHPHKPPNHEPPPPNRNVNKPPTPPKSPLHATRRRIPPSPHGHKPDPHRALPPGPRRRGRPGRGPDARSPGRARSPRTDGRGAAGQALGRTACPV